MYVSISDGSLLQNFYSNKECLLNVQEFGKTKIYTALQEAGDDLSKEASTYPVLLYTACHTLISLLCPLEDVSIPSDSPPRHHT